MKLTNSLLILLLTGCATINKPKYRSTNSVFKQYVDQFMDDYYRFTNKYLELKTYINFGPQESFEKSIQGTTITEWNAQCRIYEKHPKREIWINENLWHRYKEPKKKTIIYHELGHCELGLIKHDDSIVGGKKASIMHSNTSGILSEDEENNEYYIKELFNKTDK